VLLCRHPPASSSKAKRSGGSRKKAAGTATSCRALKCGVGNEAAAAAAREGKQHSLKDYFGVVKVSCGEGSKVTWAGDRSVADAPGR
jgi:hypothetical protein